MCLVWNPLLEALASYGGCVLDPIPKILPRKLYLEADPLSLIIWRGRSLSGISIFRTWAREGLCPRPLSAKIRLGTERIPGPPPNQDHPLQPSHPLHPGATATSHPPPHQQRRRPPPEPPSPALLTLAAALRDIQGLGAPASRGPGWARIPECCCCSSGGGGSSV